MAKVISPVLDCHGENFTFCIDLRRWFCSSEDFSMETSRCRWTFAPSSHTRIKYDDERYDFLEVIVRKINLVVLGHILDMGARMAVRHRDDLTK